MSRTAVVPIFHGSNLPAGARFARVEELHALTPEGRERVEVWTGRSRLGFDQWMPAGRLLLSPPRYGESSLSNAPSGLVVVVRNRP